MTTVLLILLRIAWGLICLASAGFTMLLFAFADSPDLGARAAKLFTPTMVVGLIAYGIGGVLMIRPHHWWQVVIAFALVAVPPAMVLSAYNQPK